MSKDHTVDPSSTSTSSQSENCKSQDSELCATEEASNETKKEFTFSDLAFKKDEDGKLVVNIVNEEDFTESTPCDAYNTSSGIDEPFYPYPGKFGHYHYEDYTSGLRIHKPGGEDAWKQIESLIGLDSVKAQLQDIQSRIYFDQKRAKAGLKTSQSSNHFVFYGNPGTGKTILSRILGRRFKEMGLIEHGHVVEVDRSDLVGEYIGQTAIKTKEAIKAAKGGILFIDEAYSLYSSYDRDFGHEAMSTLVKAMEDNRDNMIVIMAGYKQEMDDLVRMNPGLKSRIRHHLHFPDYSVEELGGIFEKFCNEDDYILDEDAKQALHTLMKATKKLNPERMGNGRFVRNAFETTLEKMASRVMRMDLEQAEDLQTIRFSDIPSIEDITVGTNRDPYGGGGDNIRPLRPSDK